MRTLLPLTVLAIAALTSATAWAQPVAVPREGPCPSGFFASSDYCVPSASASAGQAIRRDGPCPSGFFASAGYCVTRDPNLHAIARTGPCPSGYFASAGFCVRRSR